MSGALAKALVERVLLDVEVVAGDRLALVGGLADVAELERILDVLDAAAPAHVDDAHAVALEEVDVGLRILRVAQRELARRARIGQQVPVEFDAADDEPRIGIAGDRDAGDVRAVHPVAGQADFLDRRLVLVRLERRQERS